MPDYNDDFDMRIEEMETEQLLRRVKYSLEHPGERHGRPGPAPETAPQGDFENIHLGNEMYFQLDYAARIYDPREVPANTRFRRLKGLIMRVMRLYATRQVEFNATVVKLLNMFQDRFEEVVSRFNYFRESDVRLQQRIEKLEALTATSLSALEAAAARNTEAVKSLETRLAQAAESLGRLGELQTAQARRLEGLEAAVRNLAATNEGAAARLQSIEAGFKELNGLVDDLQLRNAAIGSVFDELRAKLQSGQLGLAAPGAAPAAAAPTVLDDFAAAWNSADYELFEDESRGDMAEIRERLSFYLPFIEKAAAGGGLVADLGCGRGELQQLLKERGIAAIGIDSNQSAVHRGQQAGLDMRCQDLFAYLREAPEGGLAAITAMHVIEHLTPDQQGAFLALALKALKPGGLLAMETPNIMNLHVASCEFYSDLTHVRPVHPVALRNRMKQMGYKDIDIRFLHPFPAEEGLALDVPGADAETRKNFEKLNNVIWGCRDCVILANKKEKL